MSESRASLTVWVVWDGDGYGHRSIRFITGDEERAEREAGGGSVREVEIEDVGKAIEAALAKSRGHR